MLTGEQGMPEKLMGVHHKSRHHCFIRDDYPLFARALQAAKKGVIGRPPEAGKNREPVTEGERQDALRVERFPPGPHRKVVELKEVDGAGGLNLANVGVLTSGVVTQQLF